MIESEVDFPALQVISLINILDIVGDITNPFEPRRTKIPVFGISKLKSSTAVTAVLDENHELLKVFFRCFTEMAKLSSNFC